MPHNSKPDESLRDIMVVENPQVIKLIFSLKHNRILKLVMEKEMAISEIARALDVNPGSVHYHLKSLEKHGLVRQVREEVRGGIVKKYYRAAARRILLDTPNFNKMAPDGAGTPGEFVGPLIASIEYLGYHLPAENKEDAEELLHRYDRHIKDLMAEINGAGLENLEDDGLIVRTASRMIFILRVKEDPEIERISSEFHKLFVKYE